MAEPPRPPKHPSRSLRREGRADPSRTPEFPPLPPLPVAHSSPGNRSAEEVASAPLSYPPSYKELAHGEDSMSGGYGLSGEPADAASLPPLPPSDDSHTNHREISHPGGAPVSSFTRVNPTNSQNIHGRPTSAISDFSQGSGYPAMLLEGYHEPSDYDDDGEEILQSPDGSNPNVGGTPDTLRRSLYPAAAFDPRTASQASLARYNEVNKPGLITAAPMPTLNDPTIANSLKDDKSISDTHEKEDQDSTTTPESVSSTSSVKPIKPSLFLLYSLARWPDRLFAIPVLIITVAASLVQPYITIVIGDTFAALAAFPMNGMATDEQKQQLMHAVSKTSLKLTIAGVIGVVLQYLRSVAWLRFGERLTARLRHIVYAGVQSKPMSWFDTGMGMTDCEKGASEAVGAGGLMAKFARETDEVRIAVGITTGNMVQCIAAFIAYLALSLSKQAVLAVVILSAVPVMVVLQAITNYVAMPMYAVERRGFAEASTNVERATAAIATVKVHNAQAIEQERFEQGIFKARDSLVKQAAVWAGCIGGSEFLLLAMFVVGFWYGAKLVHDGKAGIAEVMNVFWACLLATSSLEQVVPQLMYIVKGANSLASLLTVIRDVDSPDTEPVAVTKYKRGTMPPSTHRFRGQFDLRDVAFAYPSRPDAPILRGITIFLPAGETTFIVGSSGSGKSTIAQLLLRMYEPDSGEIELDGNAFLELDRNYTRQEIAAIQQGCILFDMSVHDNVALGVVGSGPMDDRHIRQPEDVTREQVIEACQMACIHDFIIELPQGYDTMLGTGGSQLSGGQRQRLAIARARIRDPIVLILDEATSALDASSRVSVFKQIKAWRTNATTIVITHDLSQIDDTDFVYVMSDGVVAEQGFRVDLIKHRGRDGTGTGGKGIFADMAAQQAAAPLPVRSDFPWASGSGADQYFGDDEPEMPESMGIGTASIVDKIRPVSILGPGSAVWQDGAGESSRPRLRRSMSTMNDRARRHTVDVRGRADSNPDRRSMAKPEPGYHFDARRLSWSADRKYMSEFGLHRRVGSVVSEARTKAESVHKDINDDGFELVPTAEEDIDAPRPRMGFTAVVRRFYPTVPNKPMLFAGILASIAHGVLTPIWSWMMAKLLALLGVGSLSVVSQKGGILLAICLAQAVAYGAQEWTLDVVAARWNASIRSQAYTRVLAQEKSWFDQGINSPARLMQHLIKDVDDMRALVAIIVPRTVVIVMMIGLGIIWAAVVGWQLTLVGLAMAPVFGAMMVFGEYTNTLVERKNKVQREALARTFYESVANVRGIRAMALEPSFQTRFDAETDAAMRYAERGAWATSISRATNTVMPTFGQALMNWCGAYFMKRGILTYDQMLQVYTLVLFSLTFSTQMLSFLPMLSKAKAASADFARILSLPPTTPDTTPGARIPMSGDVTFDNVSFAYPTRPTVPVLSHFSLRLHAGECVALVGPSGCGKSTVASLLQRLYAPQSGEITIGDASLSTADATWVRSHLAVVSQVANLFDASVAANIAYGTDDEALTRADIERAARRANIHEFITSLPHGYDTALGENAALISGGQAQRLQIARALARDARILILDECTSALDVDNQRIVLDTIASIKDSRTTIFITHSIEAMRRCDRIVCIDNGRVAEDGTFDRLMARGGVFAKLMQTGEWE